MGVYSVIIEETVTGAFEVEAASAEQALELARERYRAGEYVLSPGEVQAVQMCVADEDGQAGLWEKL